MNQPKPHFELTRVLADGTQDAAEIVPIHELPAGMQTDRRGFLGAGLGTAAALLLMEGCATPPPKPMPNIPVPPGRDKISYKAYDKRTNTWHFYTLPCGSPLPPGTICTCNCVPTAAPRTVPITYTTTTCTCNKVCSCVPVAY